MAVRASHALILCPDNGQTVGYNFLKQSSFLCNEDILLLLHFLNEWKSEEALRELFPDLSPEELSASIDGLVDVGAVVRKGSSEEQEEIRKVESWDWGIPSALLHYAGQNLQFVSLEQAEALQRERAKTVRQPKPYRTHEDFGEVLALPSVLGRGRVADLMARRRTERDIEPAAIELETLSDCLFSGMGITGETENCVSRLPLSMTPSGGARNPYEAYVYAERVNGLEPGFYHYSASEHSLGLLKRGKTDDPAALIGNQAWVSNMAAIIFLCADFSRTMWKYQDNNAYRVILIEAGHIGQNIMLTATEQGCTACPSAALSHTRISNLLGLEHDLQSPIYALMLGKRPDVKG